jgi:OOP family OmpA-OmpF porin
MAAWKKRTTITLEVEMRQSIIALAAGAALLACGAASAQGYVGGALGHTKLSVDCSDTIRCDDTSTGGKLYGGYALGKEMAVEFGYYDWGKAKATTTDDLVTPVGLVRPLVTAPTTVSGSLKATGFGFGVAYTPTLSGDWSGTLRAGILWNKGKGTVDGLGSVSKTSAQPHIGLGVGYKLQPNLVVTGELDFSRVKWGASGVYETDAVRMISIGLRYSF